jgi:hypothetical protein
LTESKFKLPPPRPRTQSQVDRDEALLFAHSSPFSNAEHPSGKHFVCVGDLVVRQIARREKDSDG